MSLMGALVQQELQIKIKLIYKIRILNYRKRKHFNQTLFKVLSFRLLEKITFRITFNQTLFQTNL